MVAVLQLEPWQHLVAAILYVHTSYQREDEAMLNAVCVDMWNRLAVESEPG